MKGNLSLLSLNPCVPEAPELYHASVSSGGVVQNKPHGPDWWGSVGRHPANRKAASWSGDMAGLQVQSPVRACMEGNQLMFLSYQLMFVSLSFSLPLPFSKKQKTPSS